MHLKIRGRQLPGRTWRSGDQFHDNVHVGIQLKRDPAELVPGDADEATWETDIEVLEKDGVTDFRGPAVQGKRGERFVYLTWGNVDPDGTFTVFRRAKLMLTDILPVGSDDVVTAIVDLTDESGGPRCARLHEPALTIQHS